jgi:hypothetical protein
MRLLSPVVKTILRHMVALGPDRRHILVFRAVSTPVLSLALFSGQALPRAQGTRKGMKRVKEPQGKPSSTHAEHACSMGLAC